MYFLTKNKPEKCSRLMIKLAGLDINGVILRQGSYEYWVQGFETRNKC